MSTDITQIPKQELKNGRAESLADNKVCALALLHDIGEYSDGKSVQERLKVNQRIVNRIDAELARRDKQVVYILKVGDRGYIGRDGGPNGYSLVENKAKARRFRGSQKANRLGTRLLENLEKDGIWSTCIPVRLRDE